MNESHESEPLLADRQQRDQHPVTNKDHQLEQQLSASSHITALITLLTFAITFGGVLAYLPTLQIYENIKCSNAGRNGTTGSTEDSSCKGNDVQEELAILTGFMEFYSSLPALLFPIPYGILADRYQTGPRTMIVVAMTGVICSHIWTMVVCWFPHSFPLRFIWMSPLFQSIGGGGAVVESMLYTIVSKITTDATRADRWFLVESGAAAAAIVAHIVTPALMMASPWIPMFLGIVVLILATISIMFVSDNWYYEATKSPGSSGPSPPGADHPTPSIFLKALYHMDHRRSIRVVLLLASFLSQVPNGQRLITNYFSQRFSWPIAMTGFLLSMRAALITILYLTLPFLSGLLFPDSSSPRHGCFRNLATVSRDVALSRISLALQVSGALLVAFCAFKSHRSGTDNSDNIFSVALGIGGLATHALGDGFGTFCRAYLSTLVDQEHIASLHCTIVVIESIGEFLTGPAFAWLYAWGIKLVMSGQGSGYLGLPFYGIAIVSLVTGCGVLLPPV